MFKILKKKMKFLKTNVDVFVNMREGTETKDFLDLIIGIRKEYY